MRNIETPSGTDWQAHLAARIPLFGHRNWIVVADAAYPAQSNAGIETIFTGAEQMRVLRKVTDAIGASGHIRANVYVDEELTFVSEQDSSGADRYKQELDELFGKTNLSRLPHEQVIAKLDQAAEMFRVLVLKTKMMIPYTSVFFELDCGYWNSFAEQRLRQAMDKANA